MSTQFGVHGHRADILLPVAARATAARAYTLANDAPADLPDLIDVSEADVRAVAPLILMHRRQDQEGRITWDAEKDGKRVQEVLQS